jgi:carboxypeptidase Taq
MTYSSKVQRDDGTRKAAGPAGKSTRHRRTFEDNLSELKARLHEIADLAGAGALLGWDQATYMPRGGAGGRARQLAIVSRLAHERSVDGNIGRLLDAVEPYAATLDDDSDEASLIRVARRNFERSSKVPADYVARTAAFGAQSYEAWKRARPANDFPTMLPFLEKSIDLGREYAQFFAPYQHVADPMIDEADEGLTAASVRRLFASLRTDLAPIVDACASGSGEDDGCLRGHFEEGAQVAFGISVIKRIGYDFERGRIDETAHPFCTRLSAGDVRITTRVFEDDLTQALFSSLHEAGHAIYEQGIDPALDGTPLGRGASVGVHESQSRLWENIVGRSRGFWDYFYPLLQSTFPDQFDQVPIETFHRAINKVRRSLIRTEADEVTYNLHIMLRFELELRMLEGTLPAEDLPEAWREAMQSYLGIVPPDDRDGCLQDVHWFSGVMGGAFQSYTVGNILSAQFYAAAMRAHPDIAQETAVGKFTTLHDWLRENVYRHGRKFEPTELVRRATGEQMSTGAYVEYLRTKYAGGATG